MVMGEKSFLAVGQIGAYGPFINQINVQQVAYLFILAVGDLNSIRAIARRISGQAAIDMLNIRVRMAKKIIGAQDRDELGSCGTRESGRKARDSRMRSVLGSKTSSKEPPRESRWLNAWESVFWTS